MDWLSLLIFGVLGVIVSKAFEDQTGHITSRQKSAWYSKTLDMLLIIAVLAGLVIGVSRFPLGLLGLFGGAILNWVFSDSAALSS